MKLSSLSVRKLLRAIAAPVMLASTLLSGSFASADEVWASGVSIDGGWTDYNKVAAPGDDNLCWAASASNVINHWQNRYWIEDSSIPTGEAIWEKFKQSVSRDAGGNFSPAFQWWLTGDYEGTDYDRYVVWGGDVIKTDIEKFGGYYFDSCDLSTSWGTNPENYDRLANSFRSVPYSTSGDSHLADKVVEYLKSGAAVSLSIADEGGLAHAITLWGLEYEEVDGKANVTKLWLVDSDDNQYGINEEGLFAIDVTTDAYGNITFDDYWGSITGTVFISGASSINFAETDTWLYRLYKVETAQDITDGSSKEGRSAFVLQKSVTVSGASSEIMPITAASRLYTSELSSTPISLNFNEATSGLFSIASGETLEMKALYNLQFSDNVCSGNAAIAGGDDSRIILHDNQSVVFRGNTDGGAIKAAHLSIRNNGEVLFEKNVTDDSIGVLRSITAVGDVELSAAAGKCIEFRDTIYLDYSATLSLNATYTGTDNVPVEQVGDILFTGEYTEAALKEMGSKSEISAHELTASRTSEILTTTSLQGGRLRVDSGAIFRGRGLNVAADSKATVLLKGGTLDHTGYSMTFHDGTTLELSGCNTMGGNLDLQAGSTLKVSLTNAHLNKAALTYTSGSISLSESGTKLQLLLDSEAKYGNTYKLVDGVSNKYSTIRWQLVFAEQPTYFDWDNCLSWDGDSLLFSYDVMDPVWNNASGNKLWDTTSANWDENGKAGVYRDVSIVRFEDDGSGEVSLVGTLKPYSVTVENSQGKDYTWVGSGKLAGSMQLTKKGTGTLTIKCSNAYTGGTVVESGTLTVGHADALGTGKVSLKGGTLDLGSQSVENAVEVQGDATMNGASSYLGGLTLTSGALTGGQINLAQTLELRSGSIANQLVGSSGVLKLGEGKVTLSGNNTYTGKTVLSSGTLELASADALGKGDVELSGGILEAMSGITLGSGQKLLLKGGAIVGDVTLDGGEMDIHSATTITGALTLDGGVLTFHDKMLTVSGTLTIADDTTFDVSCWTETGIYRAMRIDGLVGNPEDVDFITNSRNTYELVHNGSYLVLSVSADPQTIYWDKAQGVWQERGEVEWTPAPGESLVDARFFAKDDVVFAQGGDVTIEGTVLPGSVKVSGEEALYLGGSGSIGGAASLRKEGTGLLVMNEANTYTGGTVIEDGTVIAGGVRSFGSGAIRLNGGMLDLGDYEMENDITATGGALKSTAFGGDLIVNGDLQVGPQTRARSIRLQSGSISGIPALSRARSAGASGSIVDTPVDAVSGRLDVDLLGTTSLVVSQDVVTVSGHNSYSGGTVVESGELVVEEGSSLGTGAISLMGGILRAQGSGLSLLPGQAMQMKGGRMTGNLHTSVGSLLEVTPGSSISGGLTLGGGLVSFCYTTTAWDTTALTIGGELKVTELTSITLSGTYTQDAVLMSFGSMSGDVEKLVLVDAEGTPCEDLALVREENSIVLKSAESAAAAGSSKWEYDAAVLNDLLAQSNWGIFHASHAFINTIQGEKFSGTQVGEDSTVWASAIHSFASHDGSATNMGADISHTGGAVGYEMLVGEGSCIGMALGMMAGEVQTEGSPMEMDQESTHIGIYGATRLYADSKSALTLSGYAAYGMYESTPKAQYAHTEWMQNAVQLNVRLDGSRALSESLWVSAFAGLEYFSATDDTVDGISTGELKNLRLELGSGVTWQSSKLTLHAEAAFLADIARDNPAPTVLGTCGGAANPGRLGVGISGGAAYSITPSWSVNANANADFVDGASSCSVNLGTAIRF